MKNKLAIIVRMLFVFALFFLFGLNGNAANSIEVPSTTNLNSGLTVTLKLEIPQSYKIIFFQFGDGEYFTPTNSDLYYFVDAYYINHTYGQAGTYTPTVWADNYDDTNPPIELNLIDASNSNNNPVNIHPPISNNSGYDRSWQIVGGSFVYYIIRVQNNCDNKRLSSFNINFSFDPNLTYADIAYHFLPNSLGNHERSYLNLNPSSNQISWEATIPFQETQFFYIKFSNAKIPSFDKNKMATPMMAAPIINSLTITSKDKKCGRGSNKFDSEEEVSLSHDPNRKTVISPELINPNYSQNELLVEYLIEFQNLGYAEAETVVIKDILDMNFALNIDDYILESSYWIKNGQSIAIGQNRDHPQYGDALPHELQWVLTYDANQGLHGTQHPDYQSEFYEADTKDYLSFKVKYIFDGPAQIPPCRSIMNQAEIIFDCNEIMFTNLSRIPISCNTANDSLSVGSILTNEIDSFVLNKLGCYKGITNSINFNNDVFRLNYNIVLPVEDNLMANPAYLYHWYPVDDYNLPHQANFSDRINKIDKYYLETTRGCVKQFTIFNVDKDCNIDIQITENSDGTYSAVVLNAANIDDLQDYCWNYPHMPNRKPTFKKGCHPGNRALQFIPPNNESFTVQLTNYKTGCSVSKTFPESDPPPPWPPKITALFVILALGIFFYLYKKSKSL